MKLKCPACSKILQVPDAAAGKVVKCPCGKALRAPAGQPVAAGNAPATAASAPRSPRPMPSQAAGPAARPRPGQRPGQPGAARPGSTRGVPGPPKVDAGLFDELTDTDLQPVAVVPRVTGQKTAPNPYGNSSALGKYLDEDPQSQAMLKPRQSYEVAGLGLRFGGWALDSLMYCIAFALAVAARIALQFAKIDAPGTEFYASVGFWVALAIIMIPIILNWTLISQSGQTLGKKALGTVIVDEASGYPVGFSQGVGKRWIGWGVVTSIPLVGGLLALADVFFIFSDNHKTLHDRFASTVVARKR